jgi:hypothetical protein
MKIKLFFNEIGSISFSNDNGVMYRIRKLDDIINIIIPHFNKYQLITQKYGDFVIFKNIVKLMNKDEHLNKDGLIKIINLKASLNKGLSDKLKFYFPNTIKVERPKANIPININYNWIAGFFSGDGCFSIGIYKSDTHKASYRVMLRIIFSQHSRDEVLFNRVKDVLECGFIYKHSKRNAIDLIISNFEYVYNKMIPLFNQYNIKGVKSLDYLDFCKVAELINKKSHLTLEGIK